MSARFEVSAETRKELEAVSRSRTEAKQRVERAAILLGVLDGEKVTHIAKRLGTSRPRVYSTVKKAAELGAIAALDDLVGDRGRPRRIGPEARTWIVDLACQKPSSLGYPHELWTRQLLAQHIRSHCVESGHPSLQQAAPATVTKILLRNKLKPHKVKYYVEKRDPEFERKKADILHVYREIQMVREMPATEDKRAVAYLSYDEKPGIQALETTGVERPPVAGQHPELLRDYEYVRHGTLSLMAGIDLITGVSIPHVVPRHRSREFIEWLQIVDGRYPKTMVIRIILDNHSAHTSKETRGYLATVPGRFEFIFTPKHGSWLNLIEAFFSKLARSVLRGIRVKSRDELRDRILRGIEWFNQQPIAFKWSWGLETSPA